MKKLRTLRLVSATGAQIRTGTFREREHLIVPVVALVEGVVWAVNAPSPELVLASTLERSVPAWNGRPVVMDHPDNEDGDKITANTPETLQARSYGQVFETYF